MKGPIVTVLMIGGALGAAGAAAYFANDYIEGEVQAHRAQVDAQYAPVKVVVASQNLNPGTLLSGLTVAVREVPSAFLHAEAVAADRWSTVSGRVLARPVRAGEPVLMSHLAQDLSAGFSSQLAPGMRALTIPVDEESSISGMLAPADRIDLFFTTTSGNDAVTLPLLLNVPVIATGIRTLSNEAQVERERLGHYRTVTVSVTPQEAAKIALAQDAGKITITLRQPSDSDEVAIARVTKDTLLNGPEIVRAYVPRKRIEVILGGV